MLQLSRDNKISQNYITINRSQHIFFMFLSPSVCVRQTVITCLTNTHHPMVDVTVQGDRTLPREAAGFTRSQDQTIQRVKSDGSCWGEGLHSHTLFSRPLTHYVALFCLFIHLLYSQIQKRNYSVFVPKKQCILYSKPSMSSR